jgi:plasmid stabilization system protein ParE
MGEFAVRYTDMARGDLLRLFDFMLERAHSAEDFDTAQRALDIIRSEIETHLNRTPFIYRKAGVSPSLRELIIAFGSAGYVALYEIEGNAHVNILALRHQLEDDYH